MGISFQVAAVGFKVIGFCWACFGAISSLAEEAGFREWESADGRTLEARILSVGDDGVRMKRADGRVFKIPISRFAPGARERILAWTPPPVEIVPPDEAVLTLENGGARGSGFLAEEGGRVWVYTNQHVIGDLSALRATDTKGGEISLGELEIAADRDLARFATEVRRGLRFFPGGSTGQSVAVYGNSRGSGVITRSEGEIVGVAPDFLEVSSEIVSGNSGGPVVDAEGRVLAVSSFVTFEKMSDGDPTIAGTRYEHPRRFALRVGNDVVFSEIAREEFQTAYQAFREAVEIFDESVALLEVILRNPTEKVLPGRFARAPVESVAEDHNKNLDRVQRVIHSGMPYRTKLRKVAARIVDSLEDAAETGAEALEEGGGALTDERLGWMRSELKRRSELLERWREHIVEFEEAYD